MTPPSFTNLPLLIPVFGMGLLAVHSPAPISSETMGVTMQREILMSPHGAIPSAGWALTRLNDAAATAVQSAYVYPETENPVRLYLIDTAVDNSQGIFNSNGNVTVAESVTTDGSESSSFTHGTQLLSIIAASSTGAAVGTPIDVVSYDVYTENGGSSTTVGLVADAILEAVFHSQLYPGLPGVICIASGSDDMTDSSLLQAAIHSAVQNGLTVVVSAGNNGDDASNYIPSAYGTQSGVICVGASDSDNDVYSASNIGLAVDLYAPGENVRCINPNGATGNVSGTSPAAALAAAAALVELSINPDLSPAEVEASLKQKAYASVIPLIQIDTDSDKDGMDDELEMFFGSDPLDPASRSQGPRITRTGSSTVIQFSVAEGILDPQNPYALIDGPAWKIWKSTNLNSWVDLSPSVTPVLGTPIGGLVPLTITVTDSSQRAFVQLELSIDGVSWQERNLAE